MTLGTARSSRKENFAVITIDNAPQYLLKRGLIDKKSIVEGDLKIVDKSRRNRNLQIIRKNGTSLLIKQPLSDSRENVMSIRKETLLYLLMQTDPEFMSLKYISPRIQDFDEDQNILVTEFIQKASPLSEEIFLSSKNVVGRFNKSSMLGELIGSYHRAFCSIYNSQKSNFLHGTFMPAAQIVHPTPDIFQDLSPANLKLLKLIQSNSEFHSAIRELYTDWQQQTLIHGDMKLDNVIVLTEEPSNTMLPKMWIVDWESATFGDPAWDVGSIFQEFVRSWLMLLPSTGIEKSEQLIISSSEFTRETQNSARAFWYAYLKTREISGKKADDLLIKSTKSCAVRLLQSAYESLYSAIELPNNVVYMVQVSMNIFSNIDYAIIHLLGIPFSGDDLI